MFTDMFENITMNIKQFGLLFQFNSCLIWSTVCKDYDNQSVGIVNCTENGVFMSEAPPPYPGIDPTLSAYMPPPHVNGYAGAAEPSHPPDSAAGESSS